MNSCKRRKHVIFCGRAETVVLSVYGAAAYSSVAFPFAAISAASYGYSHDILSVDFFPGECVSYGVIGVVQGDVVFL